MQFKNTEGQIARWLEVLSEFQMDIVHRPGKLHKNADGLSRRRNTSNSSEKVDFTLPDLNFVNDSQKVYKVKVKSSNDDIQYIQEQDSDIMKIKAWLKLGERPNAKETLKESHFVKSLLGQWQRLSIVENKVVRKWEVLGTKLVHWQYIVLLSHRRTVLMYSHDIKASGHLGVKKHLVRYAKTIIGQG